MNVPLHALDERREARAAARHELREAARLSGVTVAGNAVLTPWGGHFWDTACTRRRLSAEAVADIRAVGL